MSQARTKHEYDLSPEQSRFCREQEKRYIGFISGVGAGKTFAGIVRTMLNMERWNPGEMGAIVAPARRMIIDVIVPEMRELGLFDSPYNWEYKSAYSDTPGVHTPNGSRALLLSADNKRTIERLRGLNLAWWWMDEESAINPRAREILIQRIRVGEYRNGYVTTTPKGKNHTYEFFAEGVETNDAWRGRGELYEAEDRIALVGVPTDANEFLPDDYKEAMQADMPEQIRQQEVEGRFVEIGSGILTRDMLSFEHVENLSDRPLTYTIGVDLGVESDPQKARQNDTDYWAASLIAIDKQVSQAYLIDIHRQRGMSLQQGVEWLSSVVSDVPNPSIFVESNQAQAYFLDALQDAGVPATPVTHTASKEDRIIQMSIPFERGDVKLLNREIPRGEEYDPRFKEFVQEWLSWPEGRHDDAIDAVATGLENVNFAQATIMGANPYDTDE